VNDRDSQWFFVALLNTLCLLHFGSAHAQVVECVLPNMHIGRVFTTVLLISVHMRMRHRLNNFLASSLEMRCTIPCRNNFLPAERALGQASTAPVYVVLSDGRKGSPQNTPAQYRIEQLPNGFTTGELAEQLSQSSSEASGHLRMLVSPTHFAVHGTYDQNITLAKQPLLL